MVYGLTSNFPIIESSEFYVRVLRLGIEPPILNVIKDGHNGASTRCVVTKGMKGRLTRGYICQQVYCLHTYRRCHKA